jgi:hypothetical protein
VLHDVTPLLAADFSTSSRSIAPIAMPSKGDQRRSASAASPSDSKGRQLTRALFLDRRRIVLLAEKVG